MKVAKTFFFVFVAFPVSAGWAWMLLAGILHAVFGFPLFGYWLSVGTMFLISWLMGSFSFTYKLGKAYDNQVIIEEFYK